MKRLSCALPVALLASSLVPLAYGRTAATAAPLQSTLKVEVLTGSNGVDLNDYVKTAVSGLESHWLPLIAQVGRESVPAPEETVIRLAIGTNGTISAMKLVHSTQDTALDKAAWQAAKTTQFLAMPSTMKGRELELLIHFKTN